MKMIAPALAEIKPLYYPVLKLYGGEDVIQQNLEDLDPDQWLDEGESTELPEIPRDETETETRNLQENQGRQELLPEITPDIPMIIKEQDVIAEREKEYTKEFKLRSNKETRRRRGLKK